MKAVELTGISRSAGGLFFAVSSLCKNLVEQGAEIQVFGMKERFSAEDIESWKPVPVQEYAVWGPSGYSRKIRKLLAESNADLVHQHGIWKDDQWAALEWQKKTGRPVIISLHGMLDPWALKRSGWKKRLARALFADQSFRQSSCIHALCWSEVDSIRSYGLTNPVALIPNGVKLPEVWQKSGSKQPQKTLLYLGRIHPKKGLKELIDAWSTLRPDWTLIIAGWDDGGYEQGLKKLVISSGLQHSIKFKGPQFGAEKEQLFRAADAFILPSFSEGLPVAVLEAWSYGLPTVMTEFCNLPEGIAAGAALEVSPEKNSIKSGLATLFSMTDSERSEMGANGRRLVEDRFTWSKVSEDMISVYQWCLGKGPRPECLVE